MPHQSADRPASHAQPNAYYEGAVGKGQLRLETDLYVGNTSERQTTNEQSATHDSRLVDPESRVQLMAAYTVKTIRPQYSQLSNNVTYANRFTLQTGNSRLRALPSHMMSP